MINPKNFLDLWDILVNELIGDVWLFIILGFVVVVFISVRYFRMASSASIVLGILFVLMIMTTRYIAFIWIWIVTIVGIFGWVMYSRWMFRR